MAQVNRTRHSDSSLSRSHEFNMTREEERKSVIWPCVTINPCTTPQQKATGAYTHTAESESAGYWSNQCTPFHVCSSLCTHCQHLQRSFMFAWQIYTWKELKELMYKHKLTREIKHSSEYTWYLKLCAVHVPVVSFICTLFDQTLLDTMMPDYNVSSCIVIAFLKKKLRCLLLYMPHCLPVSGQ